MPSRRQSPGISGIISLNKDPPRLALGEAGGKVIYRAGKRDALPYPIHDNDLFKAGIPRNFQIFDPLDFIAEVTQHIPNKGEHQIRYYGWLASRRRKARRVF